MMKPRCYCIAVTLFLALVGFASADTSQPNPAPQGALSATESAFAAKMTDLPDFYGGYHCVVEVREVLNGKETQFSAEFGRKGEKFHHLQLDPFSSDTLEEKVMNEFSFNGVDFYYRQFTASGRGRTIVTRKPGAARKYEICDPAYLLRFDPRCAPALKPTADKATKVFSDQEKPSAGSSAFFAGIAAQEEMANVNGVATIRIDQLTVFHSRENDRLVSRPLGRTVIRSPDGGELIVGKDDWGKPGFPPLPDEYEPIPVSWYVDAKIGHLPRRIVIRDGQNVTTSDILEYSELSDGRWFPMRGKLQWTKKARKPAVYRELELRVVGLVASDMPDEFFGCPARELEFLEDADAGTTHVIENGNLVDAEQFLEKHIGIAAPAPQ